MIKKNYLRKILKKENPIALHVLLAVIVISMATLRFAVNNGIAGLLELMQPQAILYLSSFTFSFLAAYIVQYRIVCPKFMSRDKWISFGIGTISVVVLFASLRYFIDEILFFSLIGEHNYYGNSLQIPYYVFDNSYFAINAVLYSSGVYLLVKFVRNKEQIHQMQLEHERTELSILKSQLGPHFLFNTLSSFYSELINDKPAVAGDILVLSDLLRYIVNRSESDFVLLKDELSFNEKYLSLFKRRFEDRLALDYHVTGSAIAQSIPSLLLTYFVENVCKHGIITDEHNPAEIAIAITNEYLEVKTSNLINTIRSEDISGMGRENLKRRLDVYYPEQYNFEYDVKNNRYLTTLRIPLLNEG